MTDIIWHPLRRNLAPLEAYEGALHDGHLALRIGPRRCVIMGVDSYDDKDAATAALIALTGSDPDQPYTPEQFADWLAPQP